MNYNRSSLRFFTFLIVLSLILSSCGTKKEVLYFQDLQAADGTKVQDQATRIQQGDQLSIKVYAKNPETVTQFNGPMATPLASGETQSSGTTGSTVYTYQVDEDGTIDFPELGKLLIEGLTLREVKDRITAGVSSTVDNPIVKVNIVNFGVMVLGEVNQPGYIPVEDNKINIIQAIALAGDMTIKGERKEIQVLRTVDGQHITGTVDFTSVDILNSPFYWLQQGDLINVPPNTSKVQSAGLGPGTTLVLSSLIGIATVTVTIFLRNN